MVEPRVLPTDPDFVRRIEQAEASAWLDLEPTLAGSRQLETQIVDGTTLVLDRATDWPQSRVFNLGIQHPATSQRVEKILDIVRAAGIGTLGIDVTPVARPGTLARILTASGFRETDRNVVVARHTDGMPEPDTYFRLRSAREDDTDAVIDVMQRVIPAGPDWWVLLAGQIERPNWPFYVALEGGVVCGVGGMHIHEGVAWFGPVWVLEEHRRRGTQAAVIAYGVRDAASLGVDWVTTSYPAAVPGRTRNFERLGFSMVYQRRHFVWNAPVT